MITGMKQSLYRNYSGILPQRHQGTKIIELCFIIAFLMRLRRINAWQIEINEKSPLFNLYSSSLWVFVPWWLNSYILSKIKGVFNNGRIDCRP